MKEVEYFKTRVLNDIEKENSKYDGTITFEQYIESGTFNRKDIYTLFGSWNNALNESNIEGIREKGRNNFKIETEQIFRLYYIECLDMEEIAEKLNCSTPYIQKTMERKGVPRTKSKNVRKIFVGEKFSSSKYISSYTKLDYGLYKDGDSWDYNLDLAHNKEKVRKIIKCVEKYN